MSRFVVRYKGVGEKKAEDVERIRSLPGATVLGETGRMLLVEAPTEALRELIRSMPEWIAAEEKTYTLPDPHPKPVREPES